MNLSIWQTFEFSWYYNLYLFIDNWVLYIKDYDYMVDYQFQKYYITVPPENVYVYKDNDYLYVLQNINKSTSEHSFLQIPLYDVVYSYNQDNLKLIKIPYSEDLANSIKDWTLSFYDWSYDIPKKTVQNPPSTSTPPSTQNPPVNNNQPTNTKPTTWSWVVKDTSQGYSEILYLNPDWTYYLHHKNFIDTIILFWFMIFFMFTFISLSIKTFNLWRK